MSDLEKLLRKSYVRQNSEVSITLHKGQTYLDYYGNKMEQLECVGDEGLCEEYVPAQVTCSTKEQILWKCDATEKTWIENYISFENVEVKCADAMGYPGYINKDTCVLR